MKIGKIFLAVLGFFLILAALGALAGLSEVEPGGETAGYLIAVAGFIALGGWLVSIPFRHGKAKKDGK